jgi:hypothetical protein
MAGTFTLSRLIRHHDNNASHFGAADEAPRSAMALNHPATTMRGCRFATVTD